MADAIFITMLKSSCLEVEHFALKIKSVRCLANAIHNETNNHVGLRNFPTFNWWVAPPQVAQIFK